MKNLFLYLKNLGYSLFLLIFISSYSNCQSDYGNHKVLVITGGKNFERESFLKIFEDMEYISFKEVVQPEVNNLYGSPEIDNYDALVFYDFVQ
ncbi:MAG: hypothetical protein IPM32_13965 [Ignavibacteriae bacterium]|nr:hypothetical protein [Ignavibacteriota bacterium]